MSLNTIEYSRSVYTVWDLLGDVGGLYGTLFILGNYIVFFFKFIAGDGVILRLIEGLFLFEANKKYKRDKDNGNWLKYRKQANVSSWSFLRCRRDLKLYEFE